MICHNYVEIPEATSVDASVARLLEEASAKGLEISMVEVHGTGRRSMPEMTITYEGIKDIINSWISIYIYIYI